MRFAISLSPDAVRAYWALSARQRAEVRDGLEGYLRYEPKKTSKSRIKRLRGLSRPQYRLRLGDLRVFYDVAAREVQVLTIVTKQEAEAWLREKGTPP